MNERIEPVEKYLNEVSKHLGALPDRDQIIKELRAHVWDLANRLSIEKGLSVQDAFTVAVQRMEEPPVLAAKFLDEEPSYARSEWRTPITTPESKVKNEQFMVIAIIGIFSVALVALLVSTTSIGGTSSMVTSLAFLLSLVVGLLVIGMFVTALYFYDEKLFREQLENLRSIFLKTQNGAATRITKPARINGKSKETSAWSAFGEHLGGLLGAFFMSLVIVFLLFIDVTGIIPLYNENWYTVGFIATYVSLGAMLVHSLFKLVFGRVRATRLVSAGVSTIAAICSIVLILFYPFTIEIALEAIVPNAMVGIPEVFDGDTGLKVILGISAVMQILDALYNMFKFGAWKPGDRKSLLGS
ncbi:MAG: hypothetical protein ACFFD4_18280 [Candidatus Odinarchaeota archaeon]